MPSRPWSLLWGCWGEAWSPGGPWKLAGSWPRCHRLWKECLVWHQSLLAFWRWPASPSSLCHSYTHTHTFKRITLSSHPVQGSDRQRTNCTHPYRRQCRWNLQTRFLNTPDPLAAQLATISLLLASTVLRLRGGGALFLWFATFPWAKRPLGLLGHGDAGPGLPGGSRPTQALGMGGTTQRELSKSCGWLRYVSTKGNPSHVKFRWMKGMCFSGGGLNGSKSCCCFHALPRRQSIDNNSTLNKIKEDIFTIVV